MSWKETDPLTVWKNSTIVPIGPNEANLFETTKPPVSETNSALTPIQSQRNEIWKNLSNLRSTDQQRYFDVLIYNWPFKYERFAFQLPCYVSGFTNAFMGLYLSSKIVSYGMYNGIYTRFMDVFRRTHKAPFILPFYSSGMTSVAVWHWLVRSDMFSESQICSSCILAKSYAVMIGSGIVLPFLTTPWLVQFFIQREGWLNLQPKNILEAIVFNYKYCRSTFPVVPYLVAIQLVIATACVYSSLWARERIFETFEIDPEIIRNAIQNKAPDSRGRRAHAWLRNKIDEINKPGAAIMEKSQQTRSLDKVRDFLNEPKHTAGAIGNDAK